MLGIQIAMTGLSALSSIQEGKARASEASFNAKQLEQSAKQSEIEGLQRANIRMREYETAKSANTAFTAFLSRDVSDRSMKAFMDRQKEIAFSDVAAVETQSRAEVSQSRTMASMERAKGRTATTAGFLGAGTAIATGFWRHEQYKVGK